MSKDLFLAAGLCGSQGRGRSSSVPQSSFQRTPVVCYGEIVKTTKAAEAFGMPH